MTKEEDDEGFSHVRPTRKTFSGPSRPSTSRIVARVAPSGRRELIRRRALVKPGLCKERTAQASRRVAGAADNGAICTAAKIAPALTATALTRLAMVERSHAPPVQSKAQSRVAEKILCDQPVKAPRRGQFQQFGLDREFAR